MYRADRAYNLSVYSLEFEIRYVIGETARDSLM
jgi:hypothetical protein